VRRWEKNPGARGSGKQCPLCGSKGTEVKQTRHARLYECRRCGIMWERDKGALYNLAAKYLERMRNNETTERALASLRQWLKAHPRALQR